jgi:hypothetical protein
MQLYQQQNLQQQKQLLLYCQTLYNFDILDRHHLIMVQQQQLLIVLFQDLKLIIVV